MSRSDKRHFPPVVGSPIEEEESRPMPDDVKTASRYQKLLEQIRAAYVSAQTGALRPSVWKREGASSYTVKREQLRASTSERGRPMPDDVKPWTEEEERELRTDVKAHWDTHDDDIRGAFATLDVERAKVAALTKERDELKAGQLALEAVVSEVILDVIRLAHDNDQLTKALQALVKSMPKCIMRPGGVPCGQPATHSDPGLTGIRFCDGPCGERYIGAPIPASWEDPNAAAIRTAVALLAKQRET